MHLVASSCRLLNDLRELIQKLNDQSYGENTALMLGSSIGKHVRHLLEFYECLLNGYEKGIINYDLRQRNERIEKDRFYTLELITQITEKIRTKNQEEDKELLLEYSEEFGTDYLPTSFARELAYNIEHTVHHQAILRIALVQLYPEIQIAEHFGVAWSTIRHKEVSTQG